MLLPSPLRGYSIPQEGFFITLKLCSTKKKYWASYVNEIESWQNKIQTVNLRLVLVGPSAGYSLNEKLSL